MVFADRRPDKEQYFVNICGGLIVSLIMNKPKNDRCQKKVLSKLKIKLIK